MPRKSKAELSVAPVTVPRVIPRPPSHLTPAQSEVWRLVMAASAGQYIASEAFPVLVEFCRAVVEADRIAAEVDRFDMAWSREPDGMKQLKALHAMQDVAARRVTNIATRLRIPEFTNPPAHRRQCRGPAQPGTAGPGTWRNRPHALSVHCTHRQQYSTEGDDDDERSD